MIASRILLALPLLTLTLALPTLRPHASRDGSCDISNQHCCETLIPHSSNSSTTLSGLLGIDAFPDSDTNLGIQCSPIAMVGSGGGQCTGTAVCCSGQQVQNGVINSGCSPMSVL